MSDYPDSQNSPDTEKPWRFQPGQSGNPGGRPRGLSAAIKELVGKDGHKCALALYAIAFGTKAERKAALGSEKDWGPKLRLDAIRELLDRGFGKAVQQHELGAGEGVTSMRVIFGGRYKDDEQRRAG